MLWGGAGGTREVKLWTKLSALHTTSRPERAAKRNIPVNLSLWPLFPGRCLFPSIPQHAWPGCRGMLLDQGAPRTLIHDSFSISTKREWKSITRIRQELFFFSLCWKMSRHWYTSNSGSGQILKKTNKTCLNQNFEKYMSKVRQSFIFINIHIYTNKPVIQNTPFNYFTFSETSSKYKVKLDIFIILKCLSYLVQEGFF